MTAICLGSFILLLDVTIVTVALPDMAKDLNASYTSLQWVIDAYSLALAAVLLVAGSLADIHGHRRWYVIGLSVFGVASLGSALAPNGDLLVTARAVQGLGGAAMFATSAALIASTYQGRDRGTAFGFWGAVNGAGAAAGPVLGGLLTEGLGWQAIFLVNLPIVAVAACLTLRVVAADRPRHERHAGARVDYLGSLAFTVCAGLVTYALITGGDGGGWGRPRVLACFAAAVLALVAFVVVEQRSAYPMLDLRLMRSPRFDGLMAAALLVQGASFGSLMLVSLWLQSLLDLSPIAGGLAMTPLALVSFAVSGAAGRFIQRIPSWVALGCGALLIALGLLVLALSVHTDSGRSSLYAGFAVIGVGVGLFTPVLVAAATASVPPRRAGMAGGAVNTFRQLGLTLAIAVFSAMFTSRARDVLAASGRVPDAQRAATALGGGQGQALLRQVPAGQRDAAAELLRHAATAGLDRLFLVSAVAAAMGAVLIFTLVRPRRTPAPAPAPEAEPLAAARG
ncbi:MFS transporter [Peterkaempfera sp. SMS 1(5)a]|uniref:MFS transporter n=1 Tax=Peterkaempfera podocarpi TaxID=3232308 RepID=UPI00367286B0